MADNYRRYSMRYAIKLNKQKKCEVRGCDRRRYNLSALCLAHWQKRNQTGHSNGRIYRLSYYRVLLEHAERIIRINRKHPFVSETLGIIDRTLFRSTRMGTPGFNRTAERYIRQIAEAVEKGKTSVADILAALVAITNAHYCCPTPFHDENEFLMNLTVRFIRFGNNKGQQLRVAAKRQIRNWLWKRLGTALIQLAKVCNEAEKEYNNRMAERAKPLKLYDEAEFKGENNV